MSDLLEQRVVELERKLAELAAEVAARPTSTSMRAPVSPPVPPPLAGRLTPPVAAAEIGYWPPPANAPAPAPYPRLTPTPNPSPAWWRAPRRTLDLEQLVGGRLLGLVGGVAVVLGLAFFVGIAVNHGWIGETARVALAGAGSALLFAVGVWLYKRQGMLPAALAVVGTAIAGMFLTLTAATAGYQLIPMTAALPLALGIGALATTIAVRWDSRIVAGLGIGGTLAAPALGDAVTTAGMAFLVVASGSAAAVLVWRRWQWLAVGASALTLGQLALWAGGQPGERALLVLLSIFAALNLALALGYEVRDASAALQPVSLLLVPFGATTLGALGYFGLPHGPGEPAGGSWLLALAVAHATVAGLAMATHRVSVEITLVLSGVALLLGDLAFGLLANGWVLGVAWAASAVGLAIVARRDSDRAELAQLALGGQLVLAIGHVLLFDGAPERLLSGDAPGPGASTVLVAIMVAAFTSARLLVDEPPEIRILLDALTIATLAYATAIALDGTALLIAWWASAVGMARLAGSTSDWLTRLGAGAFLALIVWHLLAFEAPPAALVRGLDSLPAAALALGLVATLAVLMVRLDPRPDSVALGALATVAMLYLCSTAIIDAFGPGLGQTLLSVFWAVCGSAALVAGLRRDLPVLRLSGLGLLALAAAKVFVIDLSTLGSGYRVGSFIGLGLLLLAAAFAHQRLRASPVRC